MQEFVGGVIVASLGRRCGVWRASSGFPVWRAGMRHIKRQRSPMPLPTRGNPVAKNPSASAAHACDRASAVGAPATRCAAAGAGWAAGRVMVPLGRAVRLMVSRCHCAAGVRRCGNRATRMAGTRRTALYGAGAGNPSERGRAHDPPPSRGQAAGLPRLGDHRLGDQGGEKACQKLCASASLCAVRMAGLPVEAKGRPLA